MDFAESGSQDLLIIKDKASGFLEVVKTKDKTTSSAIKALHGWIYTYGLPHGCKTDGGPSFKGRFKEYLSGMGVKHIPTSEYNAQSNGLVERGV